MSDEAYLPKDYLSLFKGDRKKKPKSVLDRVKGKIAKFLAPKKKTAGTAGDAKAKQAKSTAKATKPKAQAKAGRTAKKATGKSADKRSTKFVVKK